MRISFAGARSRFSHFLGFSAPKKSAKRAAAPGNDDADEENDYDKKSKKKNKKAGSDAPENGEDGDGNDSHMERDDDEDASAEADDDDEEMQASDDDAGDDEDDDADKKKSKKSKKAKKAKRAAADDEDDDDKESAEADDDEKKASRGSIRRARAEAYKRGRKAERARWSNIFASRHSAANLTLALRLASSTGLHSEDVIEQLSDVGGEERSRRREARNPNLGEMSGDEVRDDQRSKAIADSWDRQMKKAAPVAHQGRASQAGTLAAPRRH